MQVHIYIYIYEHIYIYRYMHVIVYADIVARQINETGQDEHVGEKQVNAQGNYYEIAPVLGVNLPTNS